MNMGGWLGTSAMVHMWRAKDLPSPLWRPGIELRLSGLEAKCLYPLSHLTRLARNMVPQGKPGDSSGHADL